MFEKHPDDTTQLFSEAGTFGEVDLVGNSRGGVLLSIVRRNHDTAGRLHEDSALAGVSVAEARRLRGLLGEATTAAEDTAVNQPGLWSDATIQHIAIQTVCLLLLATRLLPRIGRHHR